MGDESGEIRVVQESLNNEVENANAALDEVLEKLQQIFRRDDAHKKTVKEGTKKMKDLIKEVKNRAFDHIKDIESHSVQLPKDVGLKDFCMNGYIGSIIQIIKAVTAAANDLRDKDVSSMVDLQNVYTTYPAFLDLNNQLRQTPPPGEEPIVNKGTIKYFTVGVEISFSENEFEDTTYRFKYRYKKNTGGYSDFETSEDISNNRGEVTLSNLVPGSEYEVFAQVGKSGVYGDISQTPATFCTKPLDPPKNLRLKKQGFVDLELKWDQIEMENVGFDVIYKIEIKRKDSNEKPRSEFTKSANDTSIKIDKLIPGVEYEIWISTGPTKKDSPFGQPSKPISEKTKPIDPPMEIHAEPYCDGILLTWEDKRKEISSDEVRVFYNLQVRVKDEANPEDEEEDPSFMDLCKIFCPQYICKGLEKDIEYEFRVRSGVEITGENFVEGKYVSDKKKKATSTVGQAASHTWCCCVCGEELHSDKKKEAKIGFVWYCANCKKWNRRMCGACGLGKEFTDFLFREDPTKKSKKKTKKKDKKSE